MRCLSPSSRMHTSSYHTALEAGAKIGIIHTSRTVHRTDASCGCGWLAHASKAKAAGVATELTEERERDGLAGGQAQETQATIVCATAPLP